MGFGPWRVSKWLDNGPFWDPKGVKAGSKMRFSQSDCGRFGILKQVFLARFEPLLTWFGPWKVPKCLENGPFWDPKGVTIGSKPHFSKSDPQPFGMLKQVGTKKGSKVGHKCVVPKSGPRPFGMLKQVFLAHFGPVVTGFGPWKVPKRLASGPFWDQMGAKSGSKRCFSKFILDHLGHSNKSF